MSWQERKRNQDAKHGACRSDKKKGDIQSYDKQHKRATIDELVRTDAKNQNRSKQNNHLIRREQNDSAPFGPPLCAIARECAPTLVAFAATSSARHGPRA